MTFLTRLRFSGVLWVLPLACVISGYYRTTGFPQRHPDGIVEDAWTAELVAFVAPLCSLAACVAAGRLRRAVHLRRPVARRSGPRVVAQTVLPLVAGGLVAVCGADVAARGLARPLPDAALTAHVCSWLLAWTVLGYGIGSALPRLFAAPTALLTPYVVGGFAPSFSEVFWPRHLFTTIDCCLVGDRLSYRVLAAGLLAALGTTLAGYHLFERWYSSPRRWRHALAGAAVAVCFTLAIYLVKDFDVYNGVPLQP